jgi:hypothetical protein
MLKYSETVSREPGSAAWVLRLGYVGAAMTVMAPSAAVNNIEECILM